MWIGCPMKQDERPEQEPPRPSARRVRSWLLGCLNTLLLLVLAGLLFAPHFITSATFKKKVQQVVAAQTGGHGEYQSINLTYFPLPAIELGQVTLDIPDQVQGTVAALRVSPEFLPLLTGQVHLASWRRRS